MKEIIFAALLSLTPFGELRAGIPYAFASGVHPGIAYIVCVLANAIIVPIAFFFLEYIHRHLMHKDHYRSLFDRFMERTRHKTEEKVKKYGYLGLTLFVAVPLPITGAWTGALGAWFFGMNKWKAFFSILLGIAISGAIVLGILLTGATAWNWIFKAPV